VCACDVWCVEVCTWAQYIHVGVVQVFEDRRLCDVMRCD
jgi:hypothetical protein